MRSAFLKLRTKLLLKTEIMNTEQNSEKSEKALHIGGVVRSYFFTEPRYFVDDKVWFKDNKSFEMEGEIVNVETHWSKNNEAYHIYTLFKKGRKRLMHVGERNIIHKYDF